MSLSEEFFGKFFRNIFSTQFFENVFEVSVTKTLFRVPFFGSGELRKLFSKFVEHTYCFFGTVQLFGKIFV